MVWSRVGLACVCGVVLLTPATRSWADLSPYSQDFEGLVASDPAALGGDGWIVFGNVFDSGGVFLFGYGPFSAPNGGPGFSGITAGEGGSDQGDQQLVIFNDYNCCQPSNGHFNSTDLVESSVYQEQIIGAADAGSSYTFEFDARRRDIAGATTAVAFIKTLDPNAGFFVTNFITLDTTNLPTTWGSYELTLTINAGLVGQLLQFGFANTASNFESSGNIYDNLSFETPEPEPDSDGDGVPDSADNCTLIANPAQYDSNGDGIGNICDPDVTGPGSVQDCMVNFFDLQSLKDAFFSNPAGPNWNPDVDFDNSGLINFVDLQIMKNLFFGPPGPSAAGCN